MFYGLIFAIRQAMTTAVMQTMSGIAIAIVIIPAKTDIQVLLFPSDLVCVFKVDAGARLPCAFYFKLRLISTTSSTLNSNPLEKK